MRVLVIIFVALAILNPYFINEVDAKFPETSLSKVVDIRKIVTDKSLLDNLEAQGIDKDYVEKIEPYGLAGNTSEMNKKVGIFASPYAETYKDLKSDKYFSVVSQLPMVNADGVKVEVGWVLKDGVYTSKVNQFQAEVKDKTVTITIINDQSDGRKKGDKLSYTPSLFLDGKEIACGKEVLHVVDPTNENYQNNVLEWDYGICKRRLRLIEGRVLGTWVFAENPKGEVSIRYDQTGDFKLHLGQYAISDSEELIPTKEFDNPIFGYPFIVSDSLTFNPDAHTESTSVDGHVQRGSVNESWNSIVTSAGTAASDSGTTHSIYFQASGTTNQWQSNFRMFDLFDTSPLPDSAAISAAVLSLYLEHKGQDSTWSPNSCIYSSNPASSIALVAADYQEVGAVDFSNVLTYAGLAAGYNAYTLNAAGIVAISKTSISEFSVRNKNYDVANSAPGWVLGQYSWISYYASEQGTGYKPKLVVTYTLPCTVVTLAASSVSYTTARLNGNVTVGEAANVTVTFFWGDNNGNVTAENWDFSGVPTSPAQPQGVATCYKDVDTLHFNTLYYFNVRGVSSANTSWGASGNFTTLDILDCGLATFTGSEGVCGNTLSWSFEYSNSTIEIQALFIGCEPFLLYDGNETGYFHNLPELLEPVAYHAQVSVGGIALDIACDINAGGENIEALNNTFGIWLALSLALGLSFLSLKAGAYMWFVSCWPWVALATLVSTTWLQGVAILMAVVCLGLFVAGIGSKGRRG